MNNATKSADAIWIIMQMILDWCNGMCTRKAQQMKMIRSSCYKWIPIQCRNSLTWEITFHTNRVYNMDQIYEKIWILTCAESIHIDICIKIKINGKKMRLSVPFPTWILNSNISVNISLKYRTTHVLHSQCHFGHFDTEFITILQSSRLIAPITKCVVFTMFSVGVHASSLFFLPSSLFNISLSIELWSNCGVYVFDCWCHYNNFTIWFIRKEFDTWHRLKNVRNAILSNFWDSNLDVTR